MNGFIRRTIQKSRDVFVSGIGDVEAAVMAWDLLERLPRAVAQRFA
jgi:hypothetical protein